MGISFILLFSDKGEGAGLMIFALVICIPWFFSYNNHASDLAVIKEQHRVVKVYKERIESLTERLKIASSGDVKIALLNADTPIAAIVNSITNMELKIAEAETTKAKAHISVESRKASLLKSVTWFFDSPPEDA